MKDFSARSRGQTALFPPAPSVSSFRTLECSIRARSPQQRFGDCAPNVLSESSFSDSLIE